MKQIPILFNSPMVCAISREDKNITRRTRGLDKINEFPDDYILLVDKNGKIVFDDDGTVMFRKDDGIAFVKSPYGQPGDILWVRESFFLDKNDAFKDESSTYDTITYKADHYHRDIKREGVCYDNIDLCTEGWFDPDYPDEFKWQPSIHMPKRAARIWLQVEDVQLERLMDISEADAIAEGVEFVKRNGEVIYQDYINLHNHLMTARSSFLTLWTSINGFDSLKSNPWVWVIKFKVLSTTGPSVKVNIQYVQNP